MAPPLDPQLDPCDRYTLLAELGRGGLGRVWSATDETLGRLVAIKQVLEPSKDALSRFEREARLTARLQHAGVVPVYDIGWFENGEPFFVMRNVEGRSLAQLIAAAASTAARMALLPRILAVAETVAYAHEHGIIHRDLKPANVVVSDHGETLVIDWGLAKSLAERDPPALHLALATGADQPGLTQQGAVMGTPQFMAPEQAAGQPVDERADVYALGAMLYNALTGREPGGGPARPAPLRALAPELPTDLSAIVAKAMSVAPSDRYRNAWELGQDLRRFLDGRLVSAHRYTPGALLARWVRRHRAATLAVGICLLVLLVAGVLGIRRVVAERNSALAARQAALARQNALVLLQAERSLAEEPTAAFAWIKRHQPANDDDWVARAVAEEAVARGVARHVFRGQAVTRAMATARRAPLAALGGQDGVLVLADLESGRRRRLQGDGTTVRALVLDAQGTRVAALHASGRVQLWSADGARLASAELPAAANGSLSLSPDESTLAVVTGGTRVSVLAASNLAPKTQLDLGARISGVSFCADGGLLVLDKDGRAGVLTAAGGWEPLPGRHADARLACLPDQRFVTGGVDGEVHLWSPSRGRLRRLARHADWVSALAVAPDGRRVASGAGDDEVALIDLRSGQQHRLRGHEDTIRGLVFSPDGKVLISASFDSIRFWDAEQGTLLRSLATADGRATWWALAADGRWLVATAASETRIWPTATPPGRLLAPHGDHITHLRWSDDGSRLLSAGRDRVVKVHDLLTDTHWSSAPFEAWPMNASFLADGRLAVTTRVLTTWAVQPGRRDRGQRLLPSRPEAAASAPFVALDPSRRQLVYVEEDAVVIQDVVTGNKRAFAPRVPFATDVSFSADGRLLAACSRLGLAVVWEAASGRVLHVQRAQEGYDEVALAPDGASAALLMRNQRVLLWRMDDGRVIDVPTSAGVDGRIAFVGSDRVIYKGSGSTVVVIDLRSQAARVLRGHRAPITHLTASTASGLIASADASGFVRLWDLDRARAAVLYAHRGPVEEAAFAPDGRRLATSGPNGELRLWDLSRVALRAMGPWKVSGLAGVSFVEVDDQGGLATSDAVLAEPAAVLR